MLLEPGRNVANLVVPPVGRLLEVDDPVQPYCVTGRDGQEIAAVSDFLKDLRARDLSMETLKIERSDESSTARAVNGLAERGFVEVKPDWAWHVRTPIVRLIKDGRPPLFDSAEDRKLQRELDQKISVVNRDLRMRGSRIRVKTEDLGEYESSTVTVSETGRSYRVVHLYREALEPPRRG